MVSKMRWFLPICIEFSKFRQLLWKHKAIIYQFKTPVPYACITPHTYDFCMSDTTSGIGFRLPATVRHSQTWGPWLYVIAYGKFKYCAISIKTRSHNIPMIYQYTEDSIAHYIHIPRTYILAPRVFCSRHQAVVLHGFKNEIFFANLHRIFKIWTIAMKTQSHYIPI
jgi:hypothetical protein